MKQTNPSTLVGFIILISTTIFTTTYATNLESPQLLEKHIINKQDQSSPCPGKYYQNPTNPNECLPCSSNCENCNGPLPSDCQTIPSENQERILAKTCSGKFKYWDGNCDSSCEPPLVKVMSEDGSTDDTCTFPCSNTNNFLYWNGDCDSSCQGDLYQTLIVHNRKICDTKCPSSFTYWDGTCETTCDFPLTNSTVSGRKFCTFSCSSQNDFLYYDGDCSSECKYPLVNKGRKSRKFCDANCVAPQWAYWDSSCDSTCETPRVQRIEYGRYFCDYPCEATEFLYYNGTCGQTICPPSYYYSKTSRNFCESPCYAAGTYLDIYTGLCYTTCPAGYSSTSINGRKICTLGCITTYTYFNGTCTNTCTSPFKALRTSTCDSPCFASDEYLNNDGSCSSSCDSPFKTSTDTGRKFCTSPCDSDKYVYADGSCSSSCNSPNTKTTVNGYKFCQKNCKSTEYKYWDGSCESNCDSPLTKDTSVTPQTCSYPCDASDFLYYNGNCKASCDSPLVSSKTRGKNLCDSPCAASGEYLYWDKTCSSSCDSPLKSSTDTARKFCTYPCDSSASEYLYADGSCLTSCDSPLVITEFKSGKFCLSPCETGKYRYFNNSCISSCKSPLVSGEKNGELYCNYPCLITQYLYYDGSCKSSCPSPYKSRTEVGYKYCDKPSSGEETTGEDGGFLKKTFLLAPLKAGSSSLVALVKIMHYIRYLDIEMPPRLERLVRSQPRNILTLQYGATMPSETTDDFGDYSLISNVFEKPGNYSSFFVNYFQTFTSIAIILCCAFVFQFLEKLCLKKGHKTCQAIFEVLRVITKWNFCLILVMFNIDFIILYSFLEFTTAKESLGSGLPNFSFVTNLFMILIGLGLIAGLVYLVKKVYNTTTPTTSRKVAPQPQQNNNNNAPPKSSENNYLIVPGKYQEFRIFYVGFKETLHIARYFYLIYTIRIGLPIFLSCALYHFPMIQTTLQVIISITILLFILIARPIKKKVNMIQLILFETLAFMMNFCIFLLTTIHTYNYDAQGTRIRLGDAVIIGNSLTNLLSIIFLAIKLWLELKILIPLLPKMSKHEKYASFAKLWLILIQQGAMGFESIFDDLTPSNPSKARIGQASNTMTTETGLQNSFGMRRRGVAFPTIETEGDLQTQPDSTFDNYTASTRRMLKEVGPNTGRPSAINISSSQIGLKDNLSQIGRGSSATTDDTLNTPNGDSSPTIRRDINGGKKGNSKLFTPIPQKSFEPLFSTSSIKSGSGTKFKSNIKKEPYYNHNAYGGDKSGVSSGGGDRFNNSSIHPQSVTSAISLDISDNSPQMRRAGGEKRNGNRTGTDLFTGNSKIYEEERGASDGDDELDSRARRWNYTFNTAVSQNLERDYGFPNLPEEEIHSKMQRKGMWHYWKAKGKEKKPEKGVFEYSDVTITKK